MYKQLTKLTMSRLGQREIPQPQEFKCCLNGYIIAIILSGAKKLA